MRFSIRLQLRVALASCCASALIGMPGHAAEFERCKSGDEPNVICVFGLGNWGCDGPCTGGKPVTIFVAPAGYQVCRTLITRQDMKGGECFFTGGPTEVQMVCAAPDASARARVHELTVYSVSRNVTPEQIAKYKCIRW